MFPCFFYYFNLFHILYRALSSNVIIYMHPLRTCLLRLHTYDCKNVYIFEQVWLRAASVSTSKVAFMMYALKYWRPPQHTTYCLIFGGCYLKIYFYIGPLQAQHVGVGKKTKNKSVKTNARVSNWIYGSRLWELNSQHSNGVFLLPTFKRRGEMIHPDTSAEMLDYRPWIIPPKHIPKKLISDCWCN